MVGYLLRRLAWMVPTLIGMTAVVFFAMAMAPGGISATALVEGQNLEPEVKAALLAYYNRLYGLDQPVVVQYGRWLNHVSPVGWKTDAEGNWVGWPTVKRPELGTSFRYSRPVIELIAERAPVTVLLNLLSLPLVYAGAIVLGVAAAARRGSRFDQGVTWVLLLLWSAPPMLVGVLLIGFLASDTYWPLFPTGGLSSQAARDAPFWPVVGGGAWGWLMVWLLGLGVGVWIGERGTRQWGRGWGAALGIGGGATAAVGGAAALGVSEVGFLGDRLWHLVLPVVTLSYAGIAFLAKLTRASVLETLGSDFVRTARAKGLPEQVVLWRHAFRNALLPLITVAGSLLPALLAGSVVVETLFSIDGMGKLAVEAVQTRDRELVMGLTLVSGVLTLVGYLLADLAYAAADPRVRFAAR